MAGDTPFDHAIAGQDPAITNLALRQIPATTGATIEVTFLDKGRPSIVRWDWIQEDGPGGVQWRVVTVRCGVGDFMCDLKADAFSAPGQCSEPPESP